MLFPALIFIAATLHRRREKVYWWFSLLDVFASCLMSPMWAHFSRIRENSWEQTTLAVEKVISQQPQIWWSQDNRRKKSEVNCDVIPSVAALSHEMRFDRQNRGKIAILYRRSQPFRMNRGSIVKIEVKLRFYTVRRNYFRIKWGSIVKNWRKIAVVQAL